MAHGGTYFDVGSQVGLGAHENDRRVGRVASDFRQPSAGEQRKASCKQWAERSERDREKRGLPFTRERGGRSPRGDVGERRRGNDAETDDVHVRVLVAQRPQIVEIVLHSRQEKKTRLNTRKPAPVRFALFPNAPPKSGPVPPSSRSSVTSFREGPMREIDALPLPPPSQ